MFNHHHPILSETVTAMLVDRKLNEKLGNQPEP